MANLDDFFAKKDKKKKSKKFVTANTEVLATKLEESDRKEHKAEMKAVSAAMTTTDPQSGSAEGKDEEWKEYEEVKKDYSGLKIESLKIDADAENVGDDDDDVGEDGGKVRGRKPGAGPWNKKTSTSASAAQDDSRSSSPEPEPSEPAPSGPQKSAYVPPHLRGSSAAASPASTTSSASKSQQRRNKAAPDISNEFNFPSLAAAAADVAQPTKSSERSEAVFERVKSGGGQQHSRSAEAPKLALDNKFAALRDH